ncbi:MAG: hypothetical protein GAK32_00902 [Pseudomonas fluorescens]|nr:MAG: hypothetical protein GAK32_00902 [Pseudomonas fluorescens]
MIQVYRLLFLVFLMLVWEGISRGFGVEFFISRPSAVAQSLWKWNGRLPTQTPR